jgi:hypothetical protein
MGERGPGEAEPAGPADECDIGACFSGPRAALNRLEWEIVNTIIRRLDARAMLVGMNARDQKAVSEKIQAAFAQAKVRAVHVTDEAAAIERVASSMPQVVVVLGTGDDSKREVLADCAAAVGAAVIYVNPAVDEQTLEDTINGAVDEAIQRKLLLDESNRSPHMEGGGTMSEIPVALSDDEDIDDAW